jgi:hypothetical protein
MIKHGVISKITEFEASITTIESHEQFVMAGFESGETEVINLLKMKNKKMVYKNTRTKGNPVMKISVNKNGDYFVVGYLTGLVVVWGINDYKKENQSTLIIDDYEKETETIKNIYFLNDEIFINLKKGKLFI